MTLQTLGLPKKLNLRPQAGIYGETREAAMNHRIDMLFVTSVATCSRASNVIV
ncbi:hypothetical protein [Rhizobium sp. H4]|uniref:hypothetical protein n=1 Tax=Rhizobium sp. H4 TaxID=2035449 RepID=UPI001484EA4E|nr:hypothetical protein [Rhizobium sp. H4]